MCDVVGRLVSSCISHLVGWRTTEFEEDEHVHRPTTANAPGYPYYLEVYDEDGRMLRTAIEPGKPRRKYGWVNWKQGDDIIKRMQAERMSKDEEIPSMWNYDPRCLAKEFVGLDQKSFLVDPSTFNICFLEKYFLRQITKMLSPMDFLNLSYTCRFLHWRLFTFCTCYAPYPVYAGIFDINPTETQTVYDKSTEYKKALTKTVYQRSYWEDPRIVAACIPSCLRKPFFFDKLNLTLSCPYFTKDDFDRCLPFILAVRKYASQLHIHIIYTNLKNAKEFYDYEAVNDFLQTINASSYLCSDRFDTGEYIERTLKVFENCPYARMMDTTHQLRFDNRSKWKNIVLHSRIGHYINPPVSIVIRAIEEFKCGISNLVYHDYKFEATEAFITFLEYIFENYDEIEEYHNQYECSVARFVTIMTKTTGRRLMMKVFSDNDRHHRHFYVAIGKEDVFTENLINRWYNYDLEECKASPDWYRMGTAIELEEEDDGKEETPATDNSNWLSKARYKLFFRQIVLFLQNKNL